MLREDINTPVLVVDLEVLRRNILDMAKFVESVGKKLRPHIKTHKVPKIAWMQLDAGGKDIWCRSSVRLR